MEILVTVINSSSKDMETKWASALRTLLGEIHRIMLLVGQVRILRELRFFSVEKAFNYR